MLNVICQSITFSVSIPTAYNASINQFGVDAAHAYNGSSNEAMNGAAYSNDFQQSSYFSYSPMLAAMGSGPLKPNYVGCMLKNSGGHATDPLTPAEDALNSSSEIVDLDTKEIKTVETDIDMTKSMASLATNESDAKSAATTATSTDNMDGESKVEADNCKPGLAAAIPDAGDADQRRTCDKIVYDWAAKLMKKYEPGLMVNSPKMVIFFCILNESIRIGDRVLLFSQSLLTLNLIEKFLQLNQVPGDEAGSCWTYNHHYFRKSSEHSATSPTSTH